MSYAIFRSESINTLKDLGEIGAHNKRDKKSYKSNPDIDMSKSKNNKFTNIPPGQIIMNFFQKN